MLELSTDASINGNKAAWSFVLKTGSLRIVKASREHSIRGINYYELKAIVFGLSHIPFASNVTIYTDSEHVIHFSKKLPTSKLWHEFFTLRHIHKITFVKVGKNHFHTDQQLAHVMARKALRNDCNTAICEAIVSKNQK